MLQTDYGMVNMTSIFADLTAQLLTLPYDYDTLHDIKNLICYIHLRKFNPGRN